MQSTLNETAASNETATSNNTVYINWYILHEMMQSTLNDTV